MVMLCTVCTFHTVRVRYIPYMYTYMVQPYVYGMVFVPYAYIYIAIIIILFTIITNTTNTYVKVDYLT